MKEVSIDDFRSRIVAAVQSAISLYVNEVPVEHQTLRISAVATSGTDIKVRVKYSGRKIVRAAMRRTGQKMEMRDWETLLSHKWPHGYYKEVFKFLYHNGNTGLSRIEMVELLGRNFLGLNAEYSAFNVPLREAGVPYRLLRDEAGRAKLYKVAPLKKSVIKDRT